MSLHPPSRDRNHHPIPRSSVQPAWKGAGRKDQMAAARQRRHPRLRRTPTVTSLSAATQSRRQDKEQALRRLSPAVSIRSRVGRGGGAGAPDHAPGVLSPRVWSQYRLLAREADTSLDSRRTAQAGACHRGDTRGPGRGQQGRACSLPPEKTARPRLAGGAPVTVVTPRRQCEAAAHRASDGGGGRRPPRRRPSPRQPSTGVWHPAARSVTAQRAAPPCPACDGEGARVPWSRREAAGPGP